MTKRWENFSKEEIETFVKESRSYRELASKIGYSPDSGGSRIALQNMIKELNLDCSHFIGQGWNKDNFDYSRFQKGVAINISSALPALTALRGYKCEQCSLDRWNNQKIPLEIHHKDGDHLNNELDNLILLCPNCHAQTDNYKKKNKRDKEYSDEEYAEALRTHPNVRQALLSLGLNGSGGNYKRAYEIAFKYNIKHIMEKCGSVA